MFRLLVLLTALALFLGIRDYYAPERATDRLIAAPYGAERSRIKPGWGWREYPCGEFDAQVGEGYALASLVKEYGRFLRLRFFTYAEPSLDSLREVLLMGSFEGFADSEQAARRLRDRMLSRLRKKGFAGTFADRVAFGDREKLVLKNVVPLARDSLNAHVCHGWNPRRQRWFARAAVQHQLVRDYGDERAPRWPAWWTFERLVMPDSLIRELEDAGVHRIFGVAEWERIKSISRNGGNGFTAGGLVGRIKQIDLREIPHEHRPAFLLLKSYLVRYLFVYGIPGITKKHSLHDIELPPLNVDYAISENGRKAVYGETFLFALAREYPDTYWGQFAFLETFRMGFARPSGYRPRSWWGDMDRMGKEFLDKYPGSEFAPDVLFYLGKRKEAEYNHSVGRGNRAYHYKNRWRSRPLPAFADTLRKETLGIYERALASPKRTEYEAHLKYILPRLRAGIITGYNYF